jgi:hypothetical protein
MARQPEVFVRALGPVEAPRLVKITRTARDRVRLRRAGSVLASVQGRSAAEAAAMFAASQQCAREVIHAFNEKGFAALDPKWSGGRPRRFGPFARGVGLPGGQDPTSASSAAARFLPATPTSPQARPGARQRRRRGPFPITGHALLRCADRRRGPHLQAGRRSTSTCTTARASPAISSRKTGRKTGRRHTRRGTLLK